MRIPGSVAGIPYEDSIGFDNLCGLAQTGPGGPWLIDFDATILSFHTEGGEGAAALRQFLGSVVERDACLRKRVGSPLQTSSIFLRSVQDGRVKPTLQY